MSGYELTKVFDRTLRHAWSATHSQIYPELARLREDGLIEQAEQGPRGRKTYAITPAGLDAVRRWMRETEPDRGGRNEVSLRTFFLWLLEQEQIEEFFRREAEHHRAQLADFEERAAREPADDRAERASRVALEWGIRHERAKLEWAEWALGEAPRIASEQRSAPTEAPPARRARARPRS